MNRALAIRQGVIDARNYGENQLIFYHDYPDWTVAWQLGVDSTCWPARTRTLDARIMESMPNVTATTEALMRIGAAATLTGDQLRNISGWMENFHS